MKYLVLPLDDELHKKFKAICSEEGRTMKDVGIELVKKYVEGKK